MKPLIFFFNLVALSLTMISISGCVSVQLPGSVAKKASGLIYKEPTKPFVSMKSDGADKVWLSSKTANTIAYLTECESTNDPSLKQLESEYLNALGKLEIVKSETSNFNGRESLATTANGEIDGINVQVRLVIFKKNNCNYTLSYSGVKKKFDSELKHFDQFVESFKVP